MNRSTQIFTEPGIAMESSILRGECANTRLRKMPGNACTKSSDHGRWDKNRYRYRNLDPLLNINAIGGKCCAILLLCLRIKGILEWENVTVVEKIYEAYIGRVRYCNGCAIFEYFLQRIISVWNYNYCWHRGYFSLINWKSRVQLVSFNEYSKFALETGTF